MDKIAKLPMQERQELIIATASKMKISEAIVEKDLCINIVTSESRMNQRKQVQNRAF